MEKYLWVVYGLLSAITAALVAIFGKMGLKDIDANAATAIRSVIMASFLCLVVVFQGKTGMIGSILENKNALFYIVLSGIAGAFSWLFYFLALKYGTVSKIVPIDRSSIVFAVVLAFLFLGEKASALSIGGILMITAGVIMVAFG